MQSDGKYRLIDGKDWMTELTVQDGLVVYVDCVEVRAYLDGLTFEKLQELAVAQHMELKRLE